MKVLAPLFFLAFSCLLFSGAPDRNVVMTNARADMVSHTAPWRDFGFKEIREGRIPFWNPRLFCGAPYFSAFESALLYPPNWIHLILPLPQALNALLLLHVFMAGIFACLWGRVRGLDWPGAILTGTVFMLSGPCFLRVYAGHLNPLAAASWAPVLFLCLDAWRRDRRRLWCLLGMFAVLMQILAGYMQFFYYTAMSAVLYAALCLPGEKRKGNFFLGLGAMYGGGLALSAVQFLPLLETSLEASRGLPSYQFAASFSLPPENLLTLLVPGLFGNLNGLAYFGRGYYWEFTLFVGVAALALAASAAADWKKTRDLALMLAALTALALGRHLPILHRSLYLLLPGYGMFRSTARHAFLIALFLSILAGTGWQSLQESSRWPKKQAILCLLAGLLLMGAALILGVGAPLGLNGAWGRLLQSLASSGEVMDGAWRLADADFAVLSCRFAAQKVLAGAGVLLAASLLMGLMKFSRRFVYGLLILAVLESAIFAFGSRSWTDLKLDYPEAWRRLLARSSPEERVLHDWTRAPNAALRLGVDDLWGYSPTILRRYAELIAASQGQDPEQTRAGQGFSRLHPIFSLLRCRHVLIGEKHVRLPSPLPRLLLVGDYTVIGDKHARLEAILSADFNPRRRVILETAPIPKPSGVASGSVRLLSMTTDRLDIEADLKAPALLLITDAYSLGWRAAGLSPGPQDRYVVLPADHALRAIPLTAGRHAIRLQYRPVSFWWGFWISAIAAALYAAALAFSIIAE